jgi:hypothetical protein
MVEPQVMKLQMLFKTCYLTYKERDIGGAKRLFKGQTLLMLLQAI